MTKSRLIAVLLMVLAVLLACTLIVGAEELPAEGTAVTEEFVPEVDLPVAEEDNTWVTRLIEYVMNNKASLLGALGDGAILVVALLIKVKTSKVKSGTDEINSKQIAFVGAMNGMIDGYNSMKQSHDKYGATEEDRNRVVGVLVAQNTAMLEMLVTAYGNSKNLPQGVKDMIMLKYANCMKSLQDDEQILAIVEAVRNNINSIGVERLPEGEEVPQEV